MRLRFTVARKESPGRMDRSVRPQESPLPSGKSPAPRRPSLSSILAWLPRVFALSNESKVGGQAIIEGVMMRSKERISWAVKQQDGQVAVEGFPFTSISRRHRFLGLPVLRGAVYLYESLVLGYRALSRSAEIAYEDGTARAATWKDGLASWASLALALAILVGLFMYFPIWLLTTLGYEKSALTFNILSGCLRVSLFLLYIVGISFWKDVRRLFEYHGAEHKAIFAFEDGKELNLDNMRPYLTFHPRCGTSFLLLVSVICIVLFAFIDTVFIRYVFTQGYSAASRLMVHFGLIPLVSGTSYEVLKLSDRFRTNAVVRFLIQPGLWLQRITTREPDDNQLAIAAKALEAAL